MGVAYKREESGRPRELRVASVRAEVEEKGGEVHAELMLASLTQHMPPVVCRLLARVFLSGGERAVLGAGLLAAGAPLFA